MRFSKIKQNYICPAIFVFISLTVNSQIHTVSKAYKKGDDFLSASKIDSAHFYFNKGLIESERLKNDSLICLGNNLNGVIFFLEGNYEEASVYYLKAYQIAMTNDFEVFKFHSLSHLSNLHNRLGDFNKALVYNKKALTYTIKNSNINLEARLSNNRALAYKALKKFDSSYFYINKAHLIFEKLRDSSSLATILINKVELLEKLQVYDSVDYYGRLVLDTLKFRLTPQQKSTALLSIASSTLKRGKLQEAEKFFEDIDSDDGEGLYFKIKVAQLESDLYAKMGDFEKANSALNKAFLYNDSLSISLKKKASLSLNYATNLEIKKAELKQQKTELDLIKMRENKRLFQLLLLIAVIIVGLLSAYIIFRKLYVRIKESTHDLLIKKEEKKEIQFSLDKKHQELMHQSMEHLKIKEDILSLVKTHNGSNEKDILSKKIDQIYQEDHAARFNKSFNNIHPRFFKELHQKYPNLSSRELNMLAFIGLRMSSKEIASLFGIGKESVEKARYRLRKKMKLSSYKNLYIELSSFLN